MALVCLEELPRLGAEAVHIGAGRNAGHIDRGRPPYLILEVAIDDRTALQLDQLDEGAKPAACSCAALAAVPQLSLVAMTALSEERTSVSVGFASGLAMPAAAPGRSSAGAVAFTVMSRALSARASTGVIASDVLLLAARAA